MKLLHKTWEQLKSEQHFSMLIMITPFITQKYIKYCLFLYASVTLLNRLVEINYKKYDLCYELFTNGIKLCFSVSNLTHSLFGRLSKLKNNVWKELTQKINTYSFNVTQYILKNDLKLDNNDINNELLISKGKLLIDIVSIVVLLKSLFINENNNICLLPKQLFKWLSSHSIFSLILQEKFYFNLFQFNDELLLRLVNIFYKFIF